MTKTSRYTLGMTALALVTLVLVALDMCSGGVSLSLGQILGGGDETVRQIVMQIRLPRMLCAILAGGALALSGAQMQAVFRNPLADPHILGISSGAALGAALAAGGIAGGALSGLAVVPAAFAGAALSSAGIIAVSSRFKGAATLLIFGVLLGFIFSAVTTLIQYFSSEESLKLYHSWVSGSYASCGWNGLGVMAASILAGIALFIGNLRGLDVILFGEDFAAASGASVSGIRTRAILSCCLMTASVTAFCGPIGFVGIVAPHLARAVSGTSVHRRLLAPTLLLGAAISLFADVLSQAFAMPIPVGATMALAGVPVIMWILLGKRLW
ncbi:MAG: iron ABC transporter permease [Bacteroidales bacterium]|nr:iron ABC transporter permease [Bacteroidales bacterium]